MSGGQAILTGLVCGGIFLLNTYVYMPFLEKLLENENGVFGKYLQKTYYYHYGRHGESHAIRDEYKTPKKIYIIAKTISMLYGTLELILAFFTMICVLGAIAFIPLGLLGLINGK